MPAKIIDGKALAEEIKYKARLKAFDFEQNVGRPVCLAVILIGDDPASQIYVRNKIKACDLTGIKSLVYRFDKNNTKQKEIEDLIKQLAVDDTVDGILLQLPIPAIFDEKELINLIPFEKDVDGFSIANAGRLMLGRDCVYPCTPAGVVRMIRSTDVYMYGLNAVIVGRSNIVGKPLAQLLLKEDCTVTICHSKTKSLARETKRADILIAAVGKPEIIKANMVKEGAIVIDVGINRTEDGLKGDVDFENVSKKAGYISPVPGGVGPMTIAVLIENTVYCAIRRENKCYTRF